MAVLVLSWAPRVGLDRYRVDRTVETPRVLALEKQLADINRGHTSKYGQGSVSPMGDTRICSMSRSWGLRGGSCGRDRAGGSNESTRRLWRDAIAVVENTKVNLGRVQIYA